MTVRKNIELSLKLRRMPKTDRKLRVEETAALLGLEDVLESRPAQLSGGQRQRVAMGRAIVRDPSVFLLDEPLSNLDAKLRAQVRRDISDLQKRLCATMVFVTHDQIEAMTMADRIVVMRDGQVQQVGTPNDLYQNPKNIFVADFIGSPSMNILNGCLVAGSDTLQFAFATGQTWELRNVKIEKGSEAFDKLESPIVLGIRPEHLSIVGAKSDITGLSAVVKSVEPLGGEAIVHVELIEVKDRASSNQKQAQIVVKVQGRFQFSVGDEVIVHLNDDSMVYLFDTETQMAVARIVETL
jgi:ABC-type sugar transport system ATPase subunit